MAKIKREYIVAIVALVVLIVLALWYLNGSSDSDARANAQDVYDQKVIAANNQFAIISNFSARWQEKMEVSGIKDFLNDYRSNLTTLSSMVNDTKAAGDTFKGYLKHGSTEYVTVTTNEQTLKGNLDFCISEYNQHASSYNDNVGEQFGKVSLF
jgi:ABC-type transporter Mla subunit MlaD